MEREELEQKVNEELGSTKLTLSDETLNGEYDDMLDEFGDDDEVNAKLVTKLANRLKRMDGQLHKNVSDEVKKYKSRQAPKPKAAPVDGGDEMPAWFKTYKEEQDKKWEAQEAQRKEAALKAEKDSVRKSVEKALKDKFKSANVEANPYILRQVLGRVDIPDEGIDVEKIVKGAEKSYYKDLKEAGLDGKAKPYFGGGRKGEGSDAVDSYWERKKKREGWGDGKKS